MIQIKDLTKTYGARRALDGLDLTLATGVTGLLGPNGAGKTTLLRCLATTLAPDGGAVNAFGLDPADRAQRTALRRRLGYLPQDPGAYPHFTAFDLVDYVAILKELTDREHRHTEVRRFWPRWTSPTRPGRRCASCRAACGSGSRWPKPYWASPTC